MKIRPKNRLFVTIFAALLVTACNDMQQSKPAISKTAQFTTTSVLLIGKVASDSSEVKAMDESNNLIASVAVENGRYKLEIPTQTKLPIVLQSGDFISVVVDADVTNYDINSFTTNIAAKAKSLGGYTRKNMILAASDSVHTPDANKTSAGFRGDPTSQYGGWH
ncbi:MAG: hypothetical protein WCL34_11745 [Methylococcaceae bacterium]